MALPGHIVTLETRRKMSASRLGKRASAETRSKMSVSNSGSRHYLFGKHQPEEVKQKLREKLSGKNSPLFGTHPSEKTLLKMSISQRGKLNHMFGKRFHHTPEAKLKMSLAAVGRVRTPETCEKLRFAAMNRVMRYEDTSIEISVQTELNRRGIKFETQQWVITPSISQHGHPCDIFIEPNIVIECDGDFWHARPDKYPDERYMYHGRTAKEIRSHDAKLNELMIANKYLVLRYWEHEINSNVEAVVNEIENAITAALSVQ